MMIFKKKPLIVKMLDYSRPFVVLNFKTYNESTGEKALELGRIAQRVSEKTGINIIICPQLIDIKELASSLTIPVYSQHIDDSMPGQSTGDVIAEHLIDINVHGSIINHSEKPMKLSDIKDNILKLKELDMTSIVCAKNSVIARKIAALEIKPSFIALEPPELIGTEISVSTARPDIIKKAVNSCAEIPLLVGAGVKDNSDMKMALSLGAKGVLLASHFVLSTNPEKFLMDLVKDI